MLIEKVQKFNKETKEVMNNWVELTVGEDMVEYLDDDMKAILEKYNQMLDLALDIVEEQAKILTELNMKVDKVLEVTNKD